MKRSLLQIVMAGLLIGIVACSKTEDLKPQNSESLKKELVVLAIDVSQSFKKDKIPPKEIKQLLLSLEKSSVASEVLIYPLGNPTKNPDVLVCKFHGLQSSNKIITLSQKKQEVLRKRKLKNDNKELFDKFLSEYDEKIYSIRKTAHTDIRSFNKWLSILVNEEQYDDYNKTMLLFSDGINSIKGVDEFYPLKKEIEGLTIYTSGLAESAEPFKQEYKALTSYKSFFEKYKT